MIVSMTTTLRAARRRRALRHHTTRLLLALVVAAIALVTPMVPATAQEAATQAPIVVNVRVEGATTTIFEGPVTTDGHDVTTAAGGTHPCDGTNGNANPEPGPTATAALDDAARSGEFTFDGTFSSQFDDFFITRIGPDEQTDTAFIGIFRNFEPTPVGGCQQRVEPGDDVLFAYDAFVGENPKRTLALTGPNVTTVGQPITVTVTDGASGEPVSGATVDGTTTGADGTATVTLDEAGGARLKAERSGAIRSNSLFVEVTS